jgi:hypothetical protein
MITNTTEEFDIKIYSHYDIHIPGLYKHHIKHNGLFVFQNDKPIIIMPFLYFRDDSKNIFTRFIEGDNIFLGNIKCIQNQNILLLDLVINLFVNDIDKSKFTNAHFNINVYFELIDYLHEKQLFVDNSTLYAKKTDMFNCVNLLISYYSLKNSISYICCYIIKSTFNESTFNEKELKSNYNNNYGLILVTNKGVITKRNFIIYKSFSDFIKIKKNDMKYVIINSDDQLLLLEQFDNKQNLISIEE